MFRVKLSSPKIKGKFIDGEPITTEWKNFDFETRTREMEEMEQAGEIIIEEVPDELKYVEDIEKSQKKLALNVSAARLQDTVFGSMHAAYKKEEEARRQAIKAISGAHIKDVALGTLAYKRFEDYHKKILSETLALQSAFSKLRLPNVLAGPAIGPVIRKEKPNELQRAKKEVSVIEKPDKKERPAKKVEGNKKKKAPKKKTVQEKPQEIESPIDTGSKENEKVVMVPEARLNEMESKISSLTEQVMSLSPIHLNSEKQESETEESRQPGIDSTTEKIQWMKSERKLVYLINELIKKGFINTTKQYRDISNHFINRRGQDFNAVQLANAFQQMNEKGYKDVDKILEDFKETFETEQPRDNS